MAFSNGGEISFALKVGSEAFPCDDAEAGADIVLEYSTNAGGAWNTIQTFFEFAYPDFTPLSVAIPVGAQTAATRFRWRQLSNGGAGQDNWALDDVFIGLPDNDAFAFSWEPAAFLDDDAIADPLATPLENDWFYVSVEDTQFGCTYTDSIFIDVGQLFELDITQDPVLCDLQGFEPSLDGVSNFLWWPND